ncbi:biotin synthase [Achromatium sp. WMS3]|nr:biotin synthase [Achromatium sp. WMS3]
MNTAIRNNWNLDEIEILLDLPFNDLLFRAQDIHRKYFDPNKIQISALLSIKTGACPEDCGYCAQSTHHDTGLERERLLSKNEVINAAIKAKKQGAQRFCMGAAWRNPTDTNLEKVKTIITEVKALGLQTCVTLGMLTAHQAQCLKTAGLDYYNHNLDTSPEFYNQVITTHTYTDRLKTLEHVRAAGIKICSGGILGLGESRQDRASLLQQLANLPVHPDSVPINLLVKIAGTPLAQTPDLDPLELVRVIATARLLMPKSHIRLAAGRDNMSDELQALCFFAGANSIFYGDRLLTTPNQTSQKDQHLFARLGIQSITVPTTDPLEPRACVSIKTC